MRAAVMAVDAGVAETPITLIADVARPVADIGERMAEVAEFAFLESERRIVG